MILTFEKHTPLAQIAPFSRGICVQFKLSTSDGIGCRYKETHYEDNTYAWPSYEGELIDAQISSKEIASPY